MPRGPKPRPVQVLLLERPRLSELAKSQQAPFVVVRRAKIIMSLASGVGVAETARRLGCSERNVRKWRARWEAAPCIEALQDSQRAGRPATIGPEVRCQVIQMACEQPDKVLLPFRDTWTQQALADALRLRWNRCISRSSVQRILSAEGLRPHKVRMWLHSPDPDFRSKVERICGLYCEPPDDAIVLCIDDKPMQALARRYATSLGPDAGVRRDFEYLRRGVCHLLAAFDVRTGEVMGEVVARRTGAALVAFLERFAQRHRGDASLENGEPELDLVDPRSMRGRVHELEPAAVPLVESGPAPVAPVVVDVEVVPDHDHAPAAPGVVRPPWSAPPRGRSLRPLLERA